MKILILGHACGPNLGSEPGFTWNWAWHLSGIHQVWVIAHPERRAEVELYLAAHPRPNLRFVWVVPASRFDPWKPGHGERGIRFHYVLWLRTAYPRAQQLHAQIGFDIAHHVSWGTIGAAPPFQRLNLPCVWGPVGGAQTTPPSFLRYFGRPWVERIRTMYVRALRFAPSLRRAAKTAKLVLATNRETAEFLTQVGAQRVQSFLDGGLPAAYVSDAPPVRSKSDRLRLLWAGRMESRKGLRLVIEALGRLTSGNVSLTVAGSGHLEPELKDLCVELGIAEKVHFMGSVPYAEMPALFRSCDAFVFSSLRDSFGSVVLEAMAQGMAIVMLDHQGVGTFVPREAAFRVPVLNPEETVERLALAIEDCSRSLTRLQDMQYAAWHFAQGQTWDKRADQMAGFYEEILAGERRLQVASQRSHPMRVPSTTTPKVHPDRAVMNEKD